MAKKEYVGVVGDVLGRGKSKTGFRFGQIQQPYSPESRATAGEDRSVAENADAGDWGGDSTTSATVPVDTESAERSSKVHSASMNLPEETWESIYREVVRRVTAGESHLVVDVISDAVSAKVDRLEQGRDSWEDFTAGPIGAGEKHTVRIRLDVYGRALSALCMQKAKGGIPRSSLTMTRFIVAAIADL